jgi:hypothetical protein
MSDLEIARQRLKDGKLSLVFVRDSKIIYETNEEGLGGFLHAMEESMDNLGGASVADKIIGRAAALLCAHARVVAAFAATMSQGGLEILRQHNIPSEFAALVPVILNSKKTDKCPFEKLVENISSPKQAYEETRQFYNRMCALK